MKFSNRSIVDGTIFVNQPVKPFQTLEKVEGGVGSCWVRGVPSSRGNSPGTMGSVTSLVCLWICFTGRSSFGIFLAGLGVSGLFTGTRLRLPVTWSRDMVGGGV